MCIFLKKPLNIGLLIFESGMSAEINALHISVEYLTNCEGSEEEEEEANDSLRRICLVG